MSLTLTQCLSRLLALVNDTGADFSHTILLESWGACMVVHWTPADTPTLDSIASLPKEAHIYCGHDSDPRGGFSFAYCYRPTSYLMAIDEGLDDAQAEDQSRCIVESMDEVANYLLGRPFKYAPLDPAARRG